MSPIPAQALVIEALHTLLPRGDRPERINDHPLRPHPTEQLLTLEVLGIQAAVALTLFCLQGFHLDWLIKPWLMFHTMVHEMSHAIVHVFARDKVTFISLRHDGSGATHYLDGRSQDDRHWQDFFSLPAGYIGEGVVGAALVFCGFSLFASEIAVIAIVIILLWLLYFVEKTPFNLAIIVFLILSFVPWFFYQRAYLLRFYVLWFGATVITSWAGQFAGGQGTLASSSSNSANLTESAQVANVSTGSDAYKFGNKFGGPSQFWGLVWLLISMACAAAAVIVGIILFHQTKEQQLRIAERFIPAFAP